MAPVRRLLPVVRSRVSALAVILVGVVLTGCGARPGAVPGPDGPGPLLPAGGAGAWKTRETIVLTAAQARQVVPKSYRVSPDGRRFAYALNKAGGQVVVADGVEDPTVYQKVADLRFSFDGKDFAVSAEVLGSQAAEGLKYEGPLPSVVLNGKRFTPVVTWRDLNTVAVAKFKAPELLAVADGKVLYNCRAIATPEATATEGEFLHVNDAIVAPRDPFAGPGALVAGLKDRAAFARRDVGLTPWDPAPGNDSSTDAVFSQNGAAWRTVSGIVGSHVVVVNGPGGETRKEFSQVSSVTLSADGKRHAYFATRAETNKSYIVVDGRVTENPGGAGVGIAFSPDGLRWAAQTQTVVVVDGTPEKKAYTATLSRPGTGHTFVWPVPSVAFSPDGKHVAYSARQTTTRKDAAGNDVQESRGLLVVDGAEVHTWPEAGPEVFWSADNRTVATTARTEPGKAFVVVVGGTAWPRFDETTPLGFGPDGRSFAARVRHNEQQSVVLDGTARSPYEEIGLGGTRVGFTPSGKVTYLALKADGSVVWVEELCADLPDDGGPRLAAGGAKASDWTPLFNGKDLSNWTFPDVSQGNFATPRPNGVKWAVTGGAITFTGKDSSYLETLGQDFRRFHFRLEARTSPGARAQLWFGQRHGPYARVAIDNTRTAQRTGSLNNTVQDAGTGIGERLAADGEWFTLEVLASGDRFVTRVNGKRAAELKSPAAPAGPIRLAVREEHPQTIEIRKVEYRALEDEAELDRPGELRPAGPRTPAATDPLLAAPEGFTPLFNGKDTTGWILARGREPWDVRDGVLFASKGSATCFSEKVYTDFQLRVVVRTAAEARVEILTRCSKADVLDLKGYSVNVDNRAKAERPTGTANWYLGSGTNRDRFPGSPVAAEDGKWNLVEVTNQGRRVVTKVNGTVVTDHDDVPRKFSNTIIDGHVPTGRIGLKYDYRSNGSPVEIARVDIRELK